jgi:hypothetical protein
MRDKNGAAVSSSNHALVFKTERLSPFGRDFECSGGDLMGKTKRDKKEQ